MARVYEGGHFTIASNVPVDDQEWNPPEGLRELFTWARSQEDWFEAMLTTGPLSYRAWCLQERIMSSRMLYVYTDRTWIWECGYKLRAANHEGMMFGLHKNTRSITAEKGKNFRIHDDLSSRELLDRWYLAVTDYSKRALSYEADKLPAISGIAAKIQPLLGSDYLCGIWREDLYGLLWHRDIIPLPKYKPSLPSDQIQLQSIAKIPSPYRAPSFSWASVNEQVRFLHLDHVGFGNCKYRNIAYLATVGSLDIQPYEGDFLGRIQEGSYISLIGRFWEPLGDTKVYLDLRPGYPLSNTSYFVIGIHFGAKFPNRYNVVMGLALSRLYAKHRLYQRVGIFQCSLQSLEYLKVANDQEYAVSGKKLSNLEEVRIFKRSLGRKECVDII